LLGFESAIAYFVTLNVMKKSIENGKEGEVNKMGIIF
jgi:hypothetical protein